MSTPKKPLTGDVSSEGQSEPKSGPVNASNASNGGIKKSKREERLAEALRANLRRRKQN